jgi:hypothetical protein
VTKKHTFSKDLFRNYKGRDGKGRFSDVEARLTQNNGLGAAPREQRQGFIRNIP